MSLLIPLIVFGVANLGMAILSVADVKRHGAAFFVFLLALAFLGPSACIVYGAYVWARTEA